MNLKVKNSDKNNLIPNNFFADEKIIELELKISKLRYICENVNPYAEIPDEMQSKLKEIGIKDFSNPFTFTNNLILLMEDAIEELESFKSMQIK
jgi:hypothetical protein